MEWSDSQLEVINADDDRILVSASAGSGKTTVMIERILRLVASGVKLSNMLICTFTKASAADMRLKLYGEMMKRKMKGEAGGLSTADISTIDSFCQRMVSTYFYCLGVDPQFEVLEENESLLLKRDAVAKSIDFSLDDGAFKELYNILRKKRKNSVLEDAILSYMDFCSINPGVKPKLSYDEGEVKKRISDYIAAMKSDLEGRINLAFRAIDEPEIKADILALLLAGLPLSGKRIKKENAYLSPCVDYLKAEAKRCNETAAKAKELLPQSRSKEYIQAFINASILACKLYAESKQRRSAVDFADLESMTLEILKSDAASEIRAKYKYIFVDEYQDINPLQESIISSIAEGNKLFMVGDLKQSIYAFRGCDPDIFKQKYYSYKKDGSGKVINLDTNYRSSKKIIDFVNNVFKEVMTEDFGGVNYKANPMEAHKQSDGYVTFNLVTGKEVKQTMHGVYSVMTETPLTFNKSEAEAALVAYRITELIKKSDADGAPISFGDIAILTRSMGAKERLVAKKLREINVPVSISENAYYLLRPETGQLINFLRLIDNRCDDKALMIAMLSPFGGFSESELARIRLSGEGSFCECVAAAAQSDDKVKKFFETLDRYTNLNGVMNVDELSDLIVSEAGYFNYAFSLGEEAAVVLDRFLEFLSGCPHKNSLHSCLRFIDDFNPYTELCGEENSVKFMTIHKSKGLEFKYVFVIGLGELFNFSDLYKQIYIGENVAMCVYDNHAAFDSDLRFLSAIDERKKQLEEELRILYVALTRAKEGLELFASLSDSDKTVAAYELMPEIVDLSRANSPLKWLASQCFLARRYDISRISVEETPERKVLFGAADDETVQKIKRYFEFSPPLRAPAKSYVSRIAHEDDEPAADIAPLEPSDGNALKRGDAYHHTMEKLNFSAPDLSVVPKEDLELIDVQKLLAAAKAMTAFDGGEMFKEQPFILRMNASEAGIEGEGSVLIQGVIDLLIINGNEATIIDYKTGREHGSFEAGYFKQVNLYAAAVEKILAKRVTKKLLYYFDSQLFVEIE